MTSRELLETYPKAASAILKHQTDEFMKSLESSDISPEFKEFAQTQQLDYETVAAFMDVNPRGVFDVFDANDIFIQITIYPDKKFTYNVNELGTTKTFNSRIEAEKEAVNAAFEILNDKL